jgi:hypothetical protein
MLVARHPDQPGLRVLISQKCNLIEDSKKVPVGFTIESGEHGPHVRWSTAPVDIDAEELLAPRKPGPKPYKQTVAERFLQDHLAGGPKRRADVVASGTKVYLSEDTIDRVAAKLGVTKDYVGKEAVWGLPRGRGTQREDLTDPAGHPDLPHVPHDPHVPQPPHAAAGSRGGQS